MSLFLDYKEILPELQILSDNFDSIHDEFVTNRESLEIRDFTDQQKEYITQNKRGFPIQFNSYLDAKQTNSDVGWHMGALSYHGVFHPCNAMYLPILCQTLSSIKAVLVAGINVLHPGASLDWHCDKDYGGGGLNTYRVLWGIDVPVEEDKYSIFQMKDESGNVETQLFENNKFYTFDSNTTHRVENMMSQPRTVIAMDVFASKSLAHINNKPNVFFRSML